MTIKKIKIADLQDINRAAEEFIQYISQSEAQSNIFAFYGHMGAGKTTFVTAICKALGVEDTVNSPTFTIVNEYRAAKGFPIYHFDFYRINKLQEAYEIGIDEYFGGDGLCFIEWPEKIEELLPDDIINVTITPQQDGSREVTITYM